MTLKEIEDKVNELAAIIDAPSDLLPTYGYYENEYATYIQIDEDGNLCCLEKSFDDNWKEDIFIMKTKDMDELLYWILSKIARSMGWDYTEKNRDYSLTFVEQRLRKQEELIGLISEDWKQKCILENEVVRERNRI